jgi:hypothetical protein
MTLPLAGRTSSASLTVGEWNAAVSTGWLLARPSEPLERLQTAELQAAGTAILAASRESRARPARAQTASAAPRMDASPVRRIALAQGKTRLILTRRGSVCESLEPAHLVRVANLLHGRADGHHGAGMSDMPARHPSLARDEKKENTQWLEY